MDGTSLTRRSFVTRAGTLAAAATVLGPQAALANGGGRTPTLGGRFLEGVLSGDPTPTGITLWTRLDGAGGDGTVELEVATDSAFRNTVARKLISTKESVGHAVKARVNGLDPYEQYHYRFASRKNDSPVGRFRTALPSDSRQPVRFAFFSCQEYTFGYYNAHALLAREDIDFVVNLGDYIYSDVALPTPIGVRNADLEASVPNAATLAGFRERYSVYRSDPLLRRMHAQFPMISTWDDHEVQNDYAGKEPDGGPLVNPQNPYSRRKRDVGYRAFFEAMPTYAIGRKRLYRKAAFGSTVDLFVLDERQYREGQPCASNAECAALDDPRAYLGDTQLDFARSGIKRSKAAWKVIANEVSMMPLRRARGQNGNVDGWAGYPVEREALLRTVRDVEDVVFITGDYHAFISGDVKTRSGDVVASEFIGGSITSASDVEVLAIVGTPGYGTPDNPKEPASVAKGLREGDPDTYDDIDFIRHGYVTCEASRDSFRATFKKLKTIRKRTTELDEVRSWRIQRGQRGLDR